MKSEKPRRKSLGSKKTNTRGKQAPKRKSASSGSVWSIDPADENRKQRRAASSDDSRPKRNVSKSTGARRKPSVDRRYKDTEEERPRRSSASDTRPRRGAEKSTDTRKLSVDRRYKDTEEERPRRSSASDTRPRRGAEKSTYTRKPLTDRRYKDAEEERPRRSSASDTRPRRGAEKSTDTRKPLTDRRYKDAEEERPRRSSASDTRPRRGAEKSTYTRKPLTDRRYKDAEEERPRRSSASDTRPRRGAEKSTYTRKPLTDRRYKDADEERPIRSTSTGGVRRQLSTEKDTSKRVTRYSEKRNEKSYDDNKSSLLSVKGKKTSRDGIRLNKFIANSGVCSRREADEFIEAGVISVNGEVVSELGARVKASDDVRFNGQRLQGEKKVYILLNKPKGYVTTVEDPHADKTVMDLVAGACKERIYPVGRLDKNTTGVLLFTNDGELTKQLTHPSNEKIKVYHVFLDKNVTKNDLSKLVEGFNLEDGIIQADSADYVEDEKSEVGIEIHSGRNRIVRRMFEHLGYKVVKLDRVYFAGLTKKGIKRGDWRILNPKEINMLKMGAYR